MNIAEKNKMIDTKTSHSKVLIVDDEISIRVSLREFLRDANYEVNVAQDADEAMEMLATKDFDVVVTDIIMPRITGVKLLKAIKEASPHVQVILMTGDPAVKTASEAVRAGAFDYLTKPIGKEAILKIVSSAARVKSLDDERRRLLEENRLYQENLEQLVEKRTAALGKKTKELDLLNKDLHALTMEMSKLEDSERKKFAEILHDDIGQKLVAIEMGILVAIRNSDDCSKETINKLKDTNVLVRGTIESIREMSSDLYPVNPYEVDLLGKKGLRYATLWYVKNVLEPAGLNTEVSIDKIVDEESYDFKRKVYRILQECFQNAMKHSSASLIKVKCDVVGDRLYLSVKDNGAGFSNDELGAHNSGVGLRLMRERVKDLDGTLTIKSEQGKGTEVIAEFPLEKRAVKKV